ncbi:hypothetical protein CAY53_05945 [Desulfobulbus oralis]|uniref:Uncharacterized protein n=1 Tax=Desulfobulbus oralis TaxID=1986146 RepID=A0A2L1GN16_9BACT|nr:hypothetical protein CAY53_05945 [Desulfobulbus oralis]
MNYQKNSVHPEDDSTNQHQQRVTLLFCRCGQRRNFPVCLLLCHKISGMQTLFLLRQITPLLPLWQEPENPALPCAVLRPVSRNSAA